VLSRAILVCFGQLVFYVIFSSVISAFVSCCYRAVSLAATEIFPAINVISPAFYSTDRSFSMYEKLFWRFLHGEEAWKTLD
jgi:hypothetical protein